MAVGHQAIDKFNLESSLVWMWSTTNTEQMNTTKFNVLFNEPNSVAENYDDAKMMTCK